MQGQFSHQIYLDVTNNRGSWKIQVRDAIFIHLILHFLFLLLLYRLLARFLSYSYIHSKPHLLAR
jgi:hypothetical protein